MSRKYEKCYICNEFGMIEMRTPNRNPICKHCIYIVGKNKCHKCKNKSYTYSDNKEPVCKNCFLELCICVKCGDKRDGNKSPLMLCKKCLHKNNKKKCRREKLIKLADTSLEYCSYCNQVDRIKKINKR